MSHRVNDEISLALARRVASELPRRPDWLQLAKDNLSRWSLQNADAPGLLNVYCEWQAILERPVEEVVRSLVDESDEGQRLRQSTPFAGTLSPREVWAIKEGVRRDAVPA